LVSPKRLYRSPKLRGVTIQESLIFSCHSEPETLHTSQALIRQLNNSTLKRVLLG